MQFDEKQIKQLAELVAENIAITQKRVLTTDETARFLGMSKSSLYKLTMAREIPFSKPHGKVAYFNREELENWLMRNRVATADELQEQAEVYCARTRTILKKRGGAR